MFKINALAAISAEQSIAMAQDVKFPSLVQTWIPDIMNRFNISNDYLGGTDHLADQQVVADG